MARPNPFTPNFGSEPLVMAGREEIIAGMDRAFRNGPGDPRLTSIFIGARGTGKTALLNAVPHIAANYGWVCASATTLPGMQEDLFQRARSQASEFLEPTRSSRLTGVSIGGALGLEWENRDQGLGNWRTKMYGILDVLEEHGSGLLFTVDEVTPSIDEMILFAATFQHFVRENRRVALLMAGLPNNISSLLSNKSASFLRRSKQYRLKRISDADIARAMLQTVNDGGRSIDRDALNAAVAASGGFPYMMQLVGFNMWEAHPNADAIAIDDVEEGIAMAAQDMRSGVFASTLTDLSEGDIAFLRAMLPDEKVSLMKEITNRMGVTSSYASQYRLRLIDQGVIGERGRGRVAFEIPGFSDYLREVLL